MAHAWISDQGGSRTRARFAAMVQRDLRFLVSEERLRRSPSKLDGVSAEDEQMLRSYGCEVAQKCGVLLRLPQKVCATAQVLLHRFYCKRSFVQFKVEFAAMAAIWLASKLEEHPRALKDVLQVYNRIERRDNARPLALLEFADPKFAEWRGQVVVTERYMLREFGFVMQVEHPHKFVLVLLSPQVLRGSDRLMQESWHLANDSLRTSVCVRFPPETIACAVIALASERIGEALPSDPPWWEMCAVSRQDIQCVVRMVKDVLAMPRARPVAVWQDLT